MGVTDREIVQRLELELKLTRPWDQWQHVIRQLRLGRVYVVKQVHPWWWHKKNFIGFLPEKPAYLPEKTARPVL